MTHLKNPHNYHESKSENPETFCAKCGRATPHVCEWCGACQSCHKGATREGDY